MFSIYSGYQASQNSITKDTHEGGLVELFLKNRLSVVEGKGIIWKGINGNESFTLVNDFNLNILCSFNHTSY